VILVDTSVWVDYFRGTDSRQAAKLDSLLGAEPLAIGDIVLTEVLQGVDGDREFEQTRALLATLDLVQVGGADVAVEAARNFRRLRALGVTVRKTVDTLIATRCIVSGLELLHADRDFAPFQKYLGLRTVDCGDARRG
jgi:predicted nucleic acid-binding protein